MAWQRGQDHDGLLEGCTVAEPIKPALTAEEWEMKRISYGNGDALDDQGCEGHGYRVTPEGVLRYEIGYEGCDRSEDIERPHALAALALYHQSFGFTRERLASLRAVIEIAEQAVLNRVNVYPAALQRIYGAKADADRIEALLPPEAL